MSEITSPKGQAFMARLPPYYEMILEFKELCQTEGVEFDDITSAASAGLDQSSVDSATFGLDRWERDFGIKTVSGKPASERRAVIKSKIRGIGTVNAALIEQVAEAYDNGDVSVTTDAANYLVTITFVSNYGVPPNLADIQAAIREILPAHLAVEFEFSYLNWSQLDGANMTWDQIDALNKTWDEFEAWNP